MENKVRYNDIILHDNSVEYIKEILSIYKEEELTINTVVLNPIIHMYAESDTADLDSGELQGYSDSLFFKGYIYDTVNRIRYYSGIHDAVRFHGVSPKQTKIFKDGSTMNVLYGECKVNGMTELCIYSKKFIKELEREVNVQD